MDHEFFFKKAVEEIWESKKRREGRGNGTERFFLIIFYQRERRNQGLKHFILLVT